MGYPHAVGVLIVMCGLMGVGQASAGHMGHVPQLFSWKTPGLDGRHRWSREGKVAKVKAQWPQLMAQCMSPSATMGARPTHSCRLRRISRRLSS